MAETNVAKSNPFNDVQGLLDALAKAPQDKQGAFRVSTWRMVIEELISLKNQIGETAVVAANAEQVAKQKPDIDALKQEIQKDLNDRISADDADTILF